MSQPPRHNRDAEAAVISAVMLDAETGGTLEQVREIIGAEQFFQVANRVVFSTICEMADAGAKIDMVSVIQRLRDKQQEQIVGGSPYLLQLIDATPSIGNATEHARLLRNLYRMRQVTALAQQADAEARLQPVSDDAAVQAWLEKTEAAFSTLVHGTEQSALVPLSAVVGNVHNAIVQARASGTGLGISTGFVDLDKQIGGWQPGDKTTVAGRPGMGKTGFAVSAGIRVAKLGHATAFFSLEQPKEQIALRVLAQEAHLDLKRLREGKISATELTKLTKAVDRAAELPFFIDDTAAISPLTVRNRLKKLQRDLRLGRYVQAHQGNVGLAIVDYLQLQCPSSGHSSYREQDVSSMTRENKETCKMLSLPMIELSQLNREAEKRGSKRPQLSDLRESGAIEQDADIIIFLYRPEYYDARDPLLKGLAEAIVAKQRHGPAGTVKLMFAAESARFENYVEDSNFYTAPDGDSDWGFDEGFE